MTETETMAGEQQFVDQYLHLGEQTPITDVQLNRFAPGYDGEFGDIVEPRQADYSATYLGWMPMALDQEEVGQVGEFDKANNEYRVRLRPGMLWDDGKEVLARDWVIQNKLDRLIVPQDARQKAPPIVDSTVGDDKYTIVYQLNSEAGYNRPGVLNSALFGKGYSLSPNLRRGSWYESRLESLQDATTKSEKQSIRQKLTNRSVTAADVDKLQFAGPYKMVGANKNVGTMETQKDHVFVDLNNINWKGVKVRFFQYANPSKRAAAFGNNDLDLIWTIVPPDLDIPDNLFQLINWETGGMDFEFNYGVAIDGGQAQNDPLMDAFKDHRVRQALANVIPPKQVAKAAKPVAQGPYLGPYSFLMPSQVRKVYPDMYKSLDEYGSPTDKQAAEQLMKDAGLSRNSSGTWVNQNGQPLSLKIMPSAQASEWQGAATGLAQVLKQFGLKTSVQVKTDPQVTASFENGTYQSSVSGWGYGRPALYLAAFHFDPQSEEGQGIQIKHQFKAPKRIGQPDSPIATWNTADIIRDVRNVPVAKTRDKVKKLIWVHNQAVVSIPVTRDGSGLEMNTETFNWPKRPPARDDVPIYHVAPGKPTEGWDQYPAVYGLEQEANTALYQAHIDGKWRGQMQAKSGYP